MKNTNSVNNATTIKTVPQVGEPLYLRQFSGSYYVDMVKTPYTVISASPSKVVVQKCKLIYPVFEFDPQTMGEYYRQFDGKRICFYDTVAESIEPDPNGYTKELVWHPKRGMWGTPGADRECPQYAVFGQWEHQPYLD